MAPTDEARERLLAAWQGEIEAGKLYELIAARETDERRAEILRKMAAAEAGHRERLEQRMRELGVAIPDPAAVRLSAWARLQARVAPIDRLLAAREAAEDDEVLHRYAKPTGDAQTDRLLSEIRREERSHSLAVADMRAGGGGASVAAATQRGAGGPQLRLDRILGRESWHRGSGGWVSGAIYGANDGLAAVFGIVSGVSGATGGSHTVLTAGLFGAIASSLSMATGAYLAERSQAEVAEANVEQERRELREHPEEEMEELSLFYQLKGLSEQEADELVKKLSRDPEAMLRALALEELGGYEHDGDPGQAALAGGISTAIGAIIPVIPFFFVTGTLAVVIAAVISLIAHFGVGAAKALFTLRKWWAAGLEMTLAGVIVGGATYLAGLAYTAVA